MKTRNGFISNSSSSSFIISSTLENFNITIPVKIDLSELGETIKTEEELNSLFYDIYGYSHKEDQNKKAAKEQKEDYEKCLKDIKNGKTIYLISIDYHDSQLQNIFVNKITPLPKEIKFITEPE